LLATETMIRGKRGMVRGKRDEGQVKILPARHTNRSNCRELAEGQRPTHRTHWRLLVCSCIETVGGEEERETGGRKGSRGLWLLLAYTDKGYKEENAQNGFNFFMLPFRRGRVEGVASRGRRRVDGVFSETLSKC